MTDEEIDRLYQAGYAALRESPRWQGPDWAHALVVKQLRRRRDLSVADWARYTDARASTRNRRWRAVENGHPFPPDEEGDDYLDRR